MFHKWRKDFKQNKLVSRMPNTVLFTVIWHVSFSCCVNELMKRLSFKIYTYAVRTKAKLSQCATPTWQPFYSRCHWCCCFFFFFSFFLFFNCCDMATLSVWKDYCHLPLAASVLKCNTFETSLDTCGARIFFISHTHCKWVREWGMLILWNCW